MTDADSRLKQLAIWSIPVAIVVFALKYFAYYVTGSVALYSDALESIVNVIAAIAAYIAIIISMKPADNDHPFGHTKAEYFSAILEGAMIFVAAIMILRESWPLLTSSHLPEQPGYGLAINLAASAINAIWAFILIKQGKISHSPALKADGMHLMTDVFTSFGVLAGLLAAILTGWAILDPVLAIIVALNILWQGWKVINNSVQGLMDVGVELEETMRIRDTISSHAAGAIEAHDLRTRVAGQVTFIEFHLVVPSKMTVGDAHDICNRIEDALKKEVENARIVIHIEPEEEAKLPKGTTAVPIA
ncbi:cation diffusion facilitator family transporter [Bartonella apis]|uniref:cation diffusion facilitator family transporter n=1 Tax=Bartonella apis TaxID=1686310 RepID=UPI00095A07BD|nr:cation diffusion facilitator family transporter [Bartonella apis]MCT6887162.1 cation diffusion facilitator family transporter [Bartonella apis]OLY45948.1 cation diffusion facilitator family transporter [Bartonella apis]OLY47534.1 cation diffusion facilitator family transporter [Bartonella apis]